MKSKAIYYEKCAVHDLEFKMVELTTKRDILLSRLDDAINDLREKRREPDDECLTENFALYNSVRGIA